MNKKYDIVKYNQLLQKRSILRTQNRSLWKEYPLESEELGSYEIILFSQIQYSLRESYIALIEKYLTDEINIFSFKADFINMVNEHNKITEEIEKNFELLSKISIDSKSSEFGIIVDNITAICHLSDCSFGFDETESMADLEFRPFLKENFLKMKKCLDN